MKIKYRGAIYPEKVIQKIQNYDYSFVWEQKMGYYLSYETEGFAFHVVDRFASFPLFYCVKDGKPYVSEKVSELVPHLYERKFDPIGYYGTGGIIKGERSEQTPFEGIKRIMPGHYLEYRNDRITLHRYWKFTDTINKQYSGTYEEACEKLSFLVRQAVKRSFEFAPNAALHLSGGLDSGTITALVCQLSNVERLAYAHLQIGAPVKHEYYESGFIREYKKHFSHLKVFDYVFMNNIEVTEEIVNDIGNWYTLLENENTEIQILEDLKSKNKKFILTGLGGDELASYGTFPQNLLQNVSNHKEAIRFLTWNLGKKKRWKKYIKILFSKKNSLVDNILADRLLINSFHRNFWFTEDFKLEAKEIVETPMLSISSLPSSYEYRLKLLEHKFFTHRSDKWNYLGNNYGISYLHPLLDADLVDFCASLPRFFFVERKDRAMFKIAMKGFVPSDLLRGGKRPMYIKKMDYERHFLISKIKTTIVYLDSLKGTFASNIYDYQKMSKMLNQCLSILNYTPASHQNTFRAIFRLTNRTNLLIMRAKYLNKYF